VYNWGTCLRGHVVSAVFVAERSGGRKRLVDCTAVRHRGPPDGVAEPHGHWQALGSLVTGKRRLGATIRRRCSVLATVRRPSPDDERRRTLALETDVELGQCSGRSRPLRAATEHHEPRSLSAGTINKREQFHKGNTDMDGPCSPDASIGAALCVSAEESAP
jgi:hypothetical protein